MLGDDVRYVWRHLPLNDVHPYAQMAAEASEAAVGAGPLLGDATTLLLAHQGDLQPARPDRLRDGDRTRRASASGDELHRHEYAARVAEDVASADASGVSGTPTFFVNGRRHYGAYDIDTLTAAVQAAGRRTKQLAARVA